MSDNQNRKRSHGFSKFILSVLIIGLCTFGVVKFVQCQMAEQVVDGQGTTQGNTDGNTHLFRRSANINDIVINSDFDMASLGGKYTVLPQVDIDGLVVTINYLDSNEKILTSFVKPLGNVKKGAQVSFSVSLLDMGLSVVWNTKYETIAVTGGTVSYFA